MTGEECLQEVIEEEIEAQEYEFKRQLGKMIQNQRKAQSDADMWASRIDGLVKAGPYDVVKRGESGWLEPKEGYGKEV